MINLFSSYYDCGDPARQEELDACLKHNIENTCIDQLMLFIDDGAEPPVSADKLTIIHLDKRPTYLDWIEHSEALELHGTTLLANSDIYFDRSILRTHEALQRPRTFLALSRWEDRPETDTPHLHPNPHWSQDVWGYRCNQAIDDNLRTRLGFPMGVPRCDNKIAYLFSIYGWSVSNPCRELKSFHVHATEYRTYNKTHDDRIMGGVAYVEPAEHIRQASSLKIDVWTRDSQHIKSVSLNKSFDKLKEAPEAEETTDAAARKPAKSLAAIHAQGQQVFSDNNRFSAHEYQGRLAYVDILSPTATYVIDKTDGAAEATGLADGLFPPVLDTAPISVTPRPKTPDDVFFWQYPCSTEEQAYRNHLSLERGANINHETRTIHCYLPLPWATFSDKAWHTGVDLRIVGRKMAGWQSLSASLGYELRVHTVCQHIHWAKKIRPCFTELGITDLHLSHLDTASAEQLGNEQIRLHSWPLIATNVENEDLSHGLEPDRDIADRHILASFIGSHMKHYRSDVRPEIAKAAASDGGSDLVVELRDQWHFNQIVYEEQVENKVLNAQDRNDTLARTKRYNEIISNSRFSLCPEGAGPNSLRIWESMAVGTVPVIIAEDWIAPGPSGNEAFNDLVIRLGNDEVPNMFSRLRAIPEARIRALSSAGKAAYQHYRTRRCF